MAIEKTLNTKLKLRYDSHESWLTADPVLLKGEVALASFSVKKENEVNYVPSVLIKVGDGEHKYSELGFTYAKAADVVAACKSESALTTFVNNVIADAGIASSEAMAALAERVTSVEGDIEILNSDEETEGSIAKTIKDAIDALDLGNTYEIKGEAAKVQTALNSYIESNNAILEEKVDKVEGKSLISDSEITRLSNVKNYDDSAITNRVKIIEDDYLKASDKESLQTQINTIMNNPDTEGVINSINEFTQYIEDHGEIAEGFRTDINKNKEDIVNLSERIDDIVIDVVELPNPNDTAQFCADREIEPSDSGWVCHVVDTLPEIGEVVSDTDISFITAYYSKTDNEAYGYVDNALGSAFGVPAGWYTLQQLFSKVDMPYGGIIHNIYEDPLDGKFYLLVTLSTGEVDEQATYRLLKGTFIHNRMLQNHCVCHTVEWADGPVGTGAPVLSFDNSDFGLVVNGYYNITDNTVYGYFDDITIEELGYYVDSLDLNDLVKLALKAALKTMKTGWKTMEEVLSLIGTAVSMPWGGVISSLNEAVDASTLYLLLTSKSYFYKNNAWIGTDITIGMPGSYTGAEVFNSLDNIATGLASHAEGRYTQATNDVAHAEGYQTIASGKVSHAEGDAAEARGYASHAEGIGTIATAEAQHVSGHFNAINGNALFIVGNGGADTARSNAFEVDKFGNAEFAGSVNANGKELATKEYVDSKEIDTSNLFITAGLKEGTAIGEFATAEGRNNISTGLTAHAEGQSVEASGHYSHAEGFESKATGLVAHAEGWGTIANGIAQHVSGKFNVANSNAAFIIGNGSSDAQRKNIVEVDWDGNAQFAGTVLSNGEELVTEERVQNLASWDILPKDNSFYYCEIAEYNFETNKIDVFDGASNGDFTNISIYFDGQEFNNVESTSIIDSNVHLGMTTHVYGNAALVDSTYEDNGLPVAIKCVTQYGSFNYATIYVSNDNLGKHVVGMYQKNIRKLDEKYISDTIARKSDIPTHVSELTNDAGYLNVQLDTNGNSELRLPEDTTISASMVLGLHGDIISITDNGNSNSISMDGSGIATLGGDFHVQAPVADESIANKSYVDNTISKGNNFQVGPGLSWSLAGGDEGYQLDIDSTVMFIFDCGGAGDVTEQTAN